MGEVNITISGKNYGISCQDGQERRVRDLGKYVDRRLKSIAQAGAADNEKHLLVLTALMLSDEVFDMRDNIGQQTQSAQENQIDPAEEEEIVQAIDYLAGRIDKIAKRIQTA